MSDLHHRSVSNRSRSLSNTRVITRFKLLTSRSVPTRTRLSALLSPARCVVLAAAVWGCSRSPEPSTSADASAPQERPAEPVAASSQILQSSTAVPSHLPVYSLTMAKGDLTRLAQTAFSNDTVPAVFSAGGVAYKGVRVRHRGDWARTWPKKPLKIFFSTNQPFAGRRRLNLNSAWRDPAMVRECLAYQIYAACGALAPTSQMVRVEMNGQFHGLYVEVEQPDKGFLKRVGLKGASVFKAASRSNQSDERDLGPEPVYQLNYRKETDKPGGYSELVEFCRDLDRTTNAVAFFSQRMDLDRYVNFLAATVLCQNWDCFNKNHFLVYDEQGSKRWFVVPWDLDRTLGDHWNWSFDEARLPALLGMRQMPGVTGWNRLEDRFLNDSTLRARLLDRLGELLRTEFTEEKLFPILDQMESSIERDAILDRQRWPSMGPTGNLRAGIAQVKRFIQRRRAYLLEEIPKLRRTETIAADPSLLRRSRTFRNGVAAPPE